MQYNNLNNVKFEHAYRFIAMKRSGHHAIINWIIENTSANIYFANNITRQKTLEIKKTGFDRNFLFYNIEDYDFEKDKDVFLKKNGQPVKTILCLRDPLNLFASRIKVSERSDYPHWFNTYGFKLFNQHNLNKSSFPTIEYHKWVSDNKYKESVAKELKLDGFEFSGSVSKYGGGSSFSGLRRNLTSKEVLSRWKTLSEDQINIIENNVNLNGYEQYYQ